MTDTSITIKATFLQRDDLYCESFLKSTFSNLAAKPMFHATPSFLTLSFCLLLSLSLFLLTVFTNRSYGLFRWNLVTINCWLDQCLLNRKQYSCKENTLFRSQIVHNIATQSYVFKLKRVSLHLNFFI